MFKTRNSLSRLVGTDSVGCPQFLTEDWDFAFIENIIAEGVIAWVEKKNLSREFNTAMWLRMRTLSEEWVDSLDRNRLGAFKVKSFMLRDAMVEELLEMYGKRIPGMYASVYSHSTILDTFGGVATRKQKAAQAEILFWCLQQPDRIPALTRHMLRNYYSDSSVFPSLAPAVARLQSAYDNPILHAGVSLRARLTELLS